MKKHLAYVTAALVLGACSGAPSSPANDPIDGRQPPDAVSLDASTDGPREAEGRATTGSEAELTGFTAQGASFRRSTNISDDALLDIVIGDADDVCGSPRAAMSHVLHLTLRSRGAMQPGTFGIVDDTVMGGSGLAPQATVVHWLIHDVGSDRCSLSNDDGGSGGTITLTRVSDDVVEGRVALTMREGDAIEGSFRATLCRSATLESLACPLSR